jgi:hypothetical protein
MHHRFSGIIGFGALGLLSVASPALAEESSPSPIVHVDAAENVLVQRASDGESVCHAPCDRALEPDVYRASGDGVRASNDFRVPSRSEPIKVRVETRSKAGFTTGIVLTTLSGLFLAGGLTMLGASLGMNGSFQQVGAALLMDGGAILMLGGSIGMGIAGIYMIATNMQSRASVLEGDLRMTATHDTTTPRALSIPIANGSF